ncbi:MAG: glycoside hydrolase family 31 protein [Myxococcaceae bacterium]|nr:glycoside hydrolase family 31 protein [Myxococcaceae bacterium]
MRTTAVVVLCLASACSSPPGPPAPSVSNGPYAVTADGGTIVLSRDGAPLVTLPADAFELGTVRELDETKSYDPYWLVYDDEFFDPVVPQGLRFRKLVSTTVTQTSATQLDLKLGFEGDVAADLTLTAEAEGRFKAKWVPGASTSPIAFMRVRLRTNPTEGFYGLGEVFDAVNHRGKLRPMQIEPDLGIESAVNEAHVPVPLLIGTTGWGVFVASKRYGLFDVARSADDLVEITYGTAEQSNAGLELHLFAAQHPLDITRKYYDVTGDPLLPGQWALGPFLWRDENIDQAQVLDDVAQIRSRDLAVSAMWIDRPYATWVNSFDFNAPQFPDPPAMIAAIRAAGLRLSLWHTPYLEAGNEPLLSQATDAGYFPPKTGSHARWGPPIDFTNPAAYTFWQTNLQRYADLGIEGYKLDYGEEVAAGLSGARTNWGFFDGSTERTMAHDFTVLYHRAYAEKIPSAAGAFLLCRAARWGDQVRASVIWPGDIDATLTKWKEPIVDGNKMVAGTGGLPSAVIAGMSLGPAGYPFFGADTGGYRHSPPNRETWVRWVEQSALSTVMQVGDSSSQMPWEYNAANGRDDAALEVFRTYARLHLRLFPYEWSYAKKLATDGRPIQRALGLAYPALGKHPDDEYLFGDDLLVAPVITAGATTRTVIFPEGEWLDWWDGSIHGKGEETVPAPLEKLPLYLRRGGIVAMLRPTIDTLSPATDPMVDSFANDAGVLWVRATNGGATTLYDGTGIEVSATQVKLTAGTVFNKGAVLEVLDVPRPASTSLTARASRAEVEASEGWFHEGRTLWLHVAPSATVTITP